MLDSDVASAEPLLLGMTTNEFVGGVMRCGPFVVVAIESSYEPRSVRFVWALHKSEDMALQHCQEILTLCDECSYQEEPPAEFTPGEAWIENWYRPR